MKNSFLKLLLTVLIIIYLVTLYGCVKVQTQKGIKKPGDTEVTQKPQYNTEDNGDPFKLQVTDPSYASIKEYVDAKADNWSASWSNDSTKVAFWIYDTNKDECRMYLWKVGENEPVYLGEETKDYYPCTFLWSPDDKYILADSGTSVLRAVKKAIIPS
jgi:Tol biopolymer transport system component